jgi:hypothetical protein
LSFEFHVLSHFRDQAEVTAAMAELKFGEELEMDKAVRVPWLQPGIFWSLVF